MRQVPEAKVVLIGNGRLAQHFKFYFSQEKIPLDHWYRKSGDPLSKFQSSKTYLLAISDTSIRQFIETYPWLKAKQLIHFSGSLTLSNAQSFHPLSTFQRESLYDVEYYRSIPIISEISKISFSEVFPNLKNPEFKIRPEQKPLYHALCVMAGNFTTLLWSNSMSKFESELGLPREILQPFLEQTFKNISSHGHKSLTGPLVRRDFDTIDKNLKALEGDSYQKVYKAFVSAYYSLKKEEQSELHH